MAPKLKMKIEKKEVEGTGLDEWMEEVVLVTGGCFVQERVGELAVGPPDLPRDVLGQRHRSGRELHAAVGKTKGLNLKGHSSQLYSHEYM